MLLSRRFRRKHVELQNLNIYWQYSVLNVINNDRYFVCFVELRITPI
jgi:hypothetical protein